MNMEYGEFKRLVLDGMLKYPGRDVHHETWLLQRGFAPVDDSLDYWIVSQQTETADIALYVDRVRNGWRAELYFRPKASDWLNFKSDAVETPLRAIHDSLALAYGALDDEYMKKLFGDAADANPSVEGKEPTDGELLDTAEGILHEQYGTEANLELLHIVQELKRRAKKDDSDKE